MVSKNHAPLTEQRPRLTLSGFMFLPLSDQSTGQGGSQHILATLDCLPWPLTAVDTWPPPSGLRTWGLSPGFPATESAEGRRQRADLWGWQQLRCRRRRRKQSSGACVGKHSDCHRKESILSSCSLEIFKLANSHCQCTQQLDPGCPHFTLEELPYSLREK